MTRASETVRRRVEDEIRYGALRPGDTIDERSLAERFEVSRTPAREALIQLAASGLVELRPRHGAVITRVGVTEAIAMMETLVALEGEAASLAARRMSAAETEQLAMIHTESRDSVRAMDNKAYIDANTRFHEAIYQGARNAYLADLIRNTRRRMAFYHASSLNQRARVERSWEEHGTVVKAIAAGDPDAAEAAMRDHILFGGRVYADLVAALQRPEGGPAGDKT
ncbi:GntR family transcriptional regulator [Acuticoccus sediminis]|uniref:GntR family transcriptional regulator n=1 Tax=Acuticoccus sediminis TaxID=2184697 RepID=A0A8B2P5B8_9HYPH|nr:GntR family transcriptional regulator [Acuticoccus sediminis]RAI03779.1 GntR family transcriptional regulator [Acuticoccus sediminis]